MPNDNFEHRHRFAVLAAARAAQRGFANVDTLRDALESTDIKVFVADPASLTVGQAKFDERHREWCRAIAENLEKGGFKVQVSDAPRNWWPSISRQ
jgi:hypothetical protein